MRLFPILTALIVMAALYLLMFERETVMAYASGEAAPETAVTIDAAADHLGEGMEAVSVVALRSQATVVDSAVLVRGRTEAARQVDVRSETSGLVISEPLRKGAAVKAGELLCELDVGTRTVALAEAEARLAGARAQLADAEINAKAAERLSVEGFAAETRVTAATAAVQSALAGVQSAEAGIAAARKELSRLQIRAPFEGLLESDTAEIGSLLQPGALCATVIQLDPIKLVGFVPEADVNKVKVGSTAGARLATGQQVIGKVTFTSRSADPQTRTFRVEVTVDNNDFALRDGQTAEIAIASDGADAHLIPQSALTLNSDGALGVRLVDAENVARFAPVSVLRDTTKGVWVSGLDADVAVIVVGQEFVTDGVPVDPTYREATR